MKFRVSFIDNVIELSSEYIRCLEIENIQYFYRFVSLLNSCDDGSTTDEIIFINNFNYKIIIDYFNIELNDKKMIGSLNKYIKENISEVDYDKLIKNYNKLVNAFVSSLDDVDLKLSIDNDVDIDKIIKFVNLKFLKDNSLLNNLLLMIDVLRELKTHDCLILVNLKQYLTYDDILELYKYAIYNGVILLLVDNKCYGASNKYEKKIIIDNNLEELVI